MHLSKSKYCRLWQCAKQLWLDTFHPELQTEDASREDRMTTGNEVGDLAMGIFGDYTEVTVLKKDGRPDISAMIEKTRACIASGVENICEASFSYDGLYCAVDILRKQDNGYVIYEVKSSTKEAEIYGVDIAYQKYVLEHCGITVAGTYLVCINSEYVRGEELDIQQLFKIVDMTPWVELETPLIPSRLKLAEKTLASKVELTCDIGEHCTNPYDCAYWEYCSRHLPKPSVFDLYRLSEKKKFEYYRKGMVSYQDMLAAPKLNEKQLRQIQFELNDCGNYIDKGGIQSFLNTLTYPIYFLDFETMQLAVPEFPGTKPYQQIPFQYSLHYIEEPGSELKHREFLAESGVDPRRSIAESLCRDIPWNVCVTAYNKGFECGRCSGKTEILAVLLNTGSASKQKEESLSLDAKPKITVAELKKLWTYQTLTIAATGEKIIELTNYKGRDKHVEIPAFIGKTRVAVVRGVFPAEVESVEFPNEDIEIKCSFRNCKAMADEDGFVCVNVGGRRVVTDYVGSKDVDTLIIPEGVTETAYGVFREVHAREVILPEGFIRLAGSSFADCRRLQKVTLPESLRTIERMAFQNCGALKQIYIPESVTAIDILDLNRTKDLSFTIYGKRGSAAHSYAEKYGNAFVEGCPEETVMPDFQVENGVLTGYIGNGGDVVIPVDVTEIGSFAFHENKTIKTLKIGPQVQMIGKYAFASCTNLTAAKICGVKAIADCAFQFSRITRVEMEEGVETIGENAFGYLSPRGAEVVIPASVLSIGKDAFYSNFNTTTLYVKAGSYAETYAKENNIPFVAE